MEMEEDLCKIPFEKEKENDVGKWYKLHLKIAS